VVSWAAGSVAQRGSSEDWGREGGARIAWIGRKRTTAFENKGRVLYLNTKLDVYTARKSKELDYSKVKVNCSCKPYLKRERK